ncbi:hypothetical protein NE398_21395 [Clostridium tertium]|uniref:Uncharacterized protein n=1 Tax=Clostridium tertium TaxID=1559 RepID=A0A9X4B4X8_9CLOT|nr:hypothetical protein [Clostridium tertium]MDC4242678.1 hypothetical protein [Clostridium tertium]
MKFYEFDKYEYYALIGAENEDNAIVGYIEVVADIEEEEKNLYPNEISIKEALKRYVKATIEGCETEKEKTRDFHKQISNFEKYVSKGIEPYIVFLIDGGLY